jgi:hypothetical protein
MNAVIATISKNANERVQVELSEFKGHDLASIRVYADKGGGDWVPTPKGITIRVEMLPGLILAMQAAEAEAKSAGLI